MLYGGRAVRHMGTRSGINRDSPDGFPRLPTMAAQRAYQHESDANLIGWDDDLCYSSSVINFCFRG